MRLCHLRKKVLIPESSAASVTPAAIRRERTAHRVSHGHGEPGSRKWAEPLILNPPPVSGCRLIKCLWPSGRARWGGPGEALMTLSPELP